MKPLPLGRQSFEGIIQDNNLYVDRTAEIYTLLQAGKYLFISRPRRFGKSLLVSTLKAIFEGKKELFKGLWIYDKIGWEIFPVIHVDFTRIGHSDASEALLNSFSVRNLNIVALLFQTGYLTIVAAKSTAAGQIYTLNFPSNEVRLAFFYQLNRQKIALLGVGFFDKNIESAVKDC